MTRNSILALCSGFILFLVCGGQAEALNGDTGQTCGGIANLQCPAGEACRFPIDQCNVADLSGTCVAVPATCPKQGPPFCGCDGKTYANECELLKAGVRPAKRGACGRGEGNSGNKASEAKECAVNSDCAAAEFCELEAGACQGRGECRVRPEVCTKDYRPVCGCDGKTYGNDCERQEAGVALRSTGECPS